MAEGSKVQQPCICADLQSTPTWTTSAPLPSAAAVAEVPASWAQHAVQQLTFERHCCLQLAGGCGMLQYARASGAGGRWSQATTAARCHIYRASVSCHLQMLHAIVVHRRPAEWIWAARLLLEDALLQAVLGAACRSL